jgi:hypothetical protein
MDELFLNDEGVVAVALLGLLGRHGMAGKVATVGIIPIERRCWRTRHMSVPALYLPYSATGSQNRSTRQRALIMRPSVN